MCSFSPTACQGCKVDGQIYSNILGPGLTRSQTFTYTPAQHHFASVDLFFGLHVNPVVPKPKPFHVGCLNLKQSQNIFYGGVFFEATQDLMVLKATPKETAPFIWGGPLQKGTPTFCVVPCFVVVSLHRLQF